MFILDKDQIPATTEELATAITASLKKSIRLPTSAVPVKITGELPNLSTMSVDVSTGEIDTAPSLPERINKNQQPGPTVGTMTVSGNPIIVGSIPIQFQLAAKQMTFNYARSKANKVVATPHEAGEGNLSIHLPQKQLDLALLTLAKKYASAHGVDILKVETSLTSLSPTDTKMLLKITAKKFMTAVIDIAGRLKIDDRMVATATELKASSSGMVGNVAVGLLQPQLSKLEGRPLPLMTFSLGNLKLREVSVDTTDGLKLSALFGSGNS